MLNIDLTLRGARMDDLDGIFSIEESSFPDPYPRGLLKAFFFMPGAYLVATAGNEVAGYAIGIMRYGSVGHIVSIAVLSEYRRRGAGKMLLGKLMEELAALGAREMRLEVRESNSQAIGLYRVAGFEQKDIIKNYYADGESALVMGLTWSRRPQR
jgi:ribosomal-protein-alanine N-acetyltransferase